MGWVLAFRSFSISLGKGVTVDSHRVSRVLGLLAFLGFSVRGGWQVAEIFRSVCRASDFEPDGHYKMKERVTLVTTKSI